jgi:putative SOS response-associated peptidase YedK
MPVILEPASYGLWLDPAVPDGRQLAERVRLLSEEALESYTVSAMVNRAGVEDPRCLEPAKPVSLW